MQLFVDLDEATGIQRQSGLTQPGCATSLRDPDDLVHLHQRAVFGFDGALRHLGHFAVQMQHHLALGQHTLEGLAHAGVVGGQNVRCVAEQVKGQLVRIAPKGVQLFAQAVLHRQRQLDTACARADDSNPCFSRVLLHAGQQGQPALIEQMNRLDRHRMVGRARHLADLRG